MTRLSVVVVAGALLIGMLPELGTAGESAHRLLYKHPYHAGYHFIPPASAYSGVMFRPPIQFGAPAYYFLGSYLPPGASYYPRATYPYQAPPARGGYYYLSEHAFGTAYPW